MNGPGKPVEALEKGLGLIPTLYYDIIARIIPGAIFCIAATCNLSVNVLQELNSTPAILFLIGAGYIAGLVLTGISLVFDFAIWDRLDCIRTWPGCCVALQGFQRDNLKGPADVALDIDEIIVLDRSQGENLFKMFAEAVAVENLLSGTLVLIVTRALGWTPRSVIHNLNCCEISVLISVLLLTFTYRAAAVSARTAGSIKRLSKLLKIPIATF